MWQMCKTSQPSSNNFCLVSKEMTSSIIFVLANFVHFLSIATFSCSDWEQYLLESFIWSSRKSSSQKSPTFTFILKSDLLVQLWFILLDSTISCVQHWNIFVNLSCIFFIGSTFLSVLK